MHYASSGYNINSGFTFASKSSGVKNPSATVASFNVVPSLWAFFAHFATSKNISDIPLLYQINYTLTIVTEMAV